MSRLLRQLLRLDAGEGPKVAHFAILGLLLQTGLAMGMSGADSLFLVEAGPDKLPYIYLLTPVLMVLYIPAYSALMGGWGLDRVLHVTLGLLVGGGLALWLALTHLGLGTLWLCYAAKLYTALWYVGLYTLFWNFIDGYFDLQDAKRLFALLAAGSAAGAIIGGSLVGPITARFGVAALFLGWAVCAAAAWPVAVWAPRRWRHVRADDDEEEEIPALREAWLILRRMLRTRYSLVLTLVLFFTLIAATTCEYQYLGTFTVGRDPAGLATLLGHLTALANVFNLGVSLFVFNLLVARLGVRNVSLLQSVAYALVFSWLLLDGGFPAAIAGFFAYQGLMTSVDFNNANLLFAGLPADRGKQMRTVIEGICEPLATATAGFMLLIVAPKPNPITFKLPFVGPALTRYAADIQLSPEQLSLIGVVVALAGLALAFILRHDYPAAIRANLRRDWIDFSQPVDPLLRPAAPPDLVLAEARAEGGTPEEAAIALRALWLGDPARAVRALLAFLQRAPAAAHRLVQPLLDQILAQPGSAAAHEIHRWLDERDSPPDPELAGELGRHRLLPARQAEALFAAAAPEARGAGAAALWQSWRVPDSRRALRQVEELLDSGQERSVLAGLRALGRLGEPRYAYLLRDYLRSPDEAVRRTALAALRTLAGPTSRVLLPEVLALLGGDAGEERFFALETFERIGDTAALAPLLAAVDTFTPAERRRTERLILHLGPAAVPILIDLTQNARFTVAGRSVALRALGKLALPQVQMLTPSLVSQMTQRAYLFLTGHLALARADHPAPEAGRAVLARICEDYPVIAVEFILEILAVAGRLPNYEALVAALRGGQSKERGYAIEAVEQACPAGAFPLLLPLLDGREAAAQVAFARERGIVADLSEDAVLAGALENGFPLAAAAAAQGLAAVGAPGTDDRLLARLCQAPHPLLAETLVTLLARRSGPETADAPTPVEVVRDFMAAPEFAACRTWHYEFLAPRTRPVAVAAGEALCRRGEPLAGIWLLRAGEVRGDDGALLGPGGVAGGALLRGARLAPATLTAATAVRANFLAAPVLRRGAVIHPELALALLARKLAA